MSPVDAILKALSNPNRRRVYQVICREGRKSRRGISIGQICRGARMKQPAVSHHVARLTRAGLIERDKRRWWVYCRPAPGALAALARFLRNPATFPLPESRRRKR